MLKSQGLSNRAIAHRLGVSEEAIRKLVGPSKPAESADCACRDHGRSGEAAGDSGGVCVQLTGNATPPAQDHTGDCDPTPAPADEGEPVPMSLDCDASDRTFDRQPRPSGAAR